MNHVSPPKEAAEEKQERLRFQGGIAGLLNRSFPGTKLVIQFVRGQQLFFAAQYIQMPVFASERGQGLEVTTIHTAEQIGKNYGPPIVPVQWELDLQPIAPIRTIALECPSNRLEILGIMI